MRLYYLVPKKKIISTHLCIEPTLSIPPLLGLGTCRAKQWPTTHTAIMRGLPNSDGPAFVDDLGSASLPLCTRTRSGASLGYLAPLALISMPDRPSYKTFLKTFRGWIKRPKSANASASPSNSTLISVSSASGAHDPVPRNDAGSAKPTASSKYIGSISVLSNSTSLQAARISVCTVLDSQI